MSYLKIETLLMLEYTFAKKLSLNKFKTSSKKKQIENIQNHFEINKKQTRLI